MLQGTFWYRGLVSAHLTAFCRANPVAGSFRVRRCSADLLRMHGDVSFGISQTIPTWILATFRGRNMQGHIERPMSAAIWAYLEAW